MRTLSFTIVLALGMFAARAHAESTLSLGPHALQALITERLFDRAGRWYLIDQGGVCYTYLESPHARLESGRLVLDARLTSRLGQRMGGACLGADFASAVTLSAALRGSEHRLILDDLRIDRIADESTRNALALAVQLAPDALPHSASVDAFEFMRNQLGGGRGAPIMVDQFRILGVATRTDAIVIRFDLSLSAP
jgi:hypothetical protein